jgi:endoglucanase
MKLLKLFILSIFVLLPLLNTAQTDVFVINKKLGRGVNMGNMFESPKEGEWGNNFRDDFFKRIKDQGFNHVRIPVRWDTPERTNLTTPYAINENFKTRIKYVVDLAMKEGLMVVLNMHHHEELFANPIGAKPKFLAQWKQIGDLFKGYNNDLLFEVMNEPHDNLTPDLWNTFFADALKVIREQNPQRAVVLGTALYGGIGGLSALKVPVDGKVIVTIHYYNPFNFTHQGAEWVNNSNPWLGTTWDDTEIEREVIQSEFAGIVQFGKANNVPINIGEFGAYSKADIKSRIRWTTYLARYIESLGFSWAYWEWSAGFGMFNPGNNTYNQELVNALLKNPMPPATKTTLKPIYCSDFSKTNDWSVFAQNGAAATGSLTEASLKVNITTKGTEGWHIQSTKTNVNIVNGKTYRLSMDIKSSNNNSVTYYVGKNSNPYNSYSGYNTASTTNEYKTFSTVFKMTDISDPIARISLDMGSAIGSIQIKSVCLEEVNLIFTPTKDLSQSFDFTVKPNPIQNNLSIEDLRNEDKIFVYDMQGKFVYKATSQGAVHTINPSQWAQGQYIVKVERENKVSSKTIVKQ